MMVDSSSLEIFKNRRWRCALISILYFATQKAGCTSTPQHAVQINPQVVSSFTEHSPNERTAIKAKTVPPEPRDCRKPVIISEIMINPEASVDKYGEYVELINAGTTTISLNKWKLRNNRAQEYHFPKVSLSPGGTVIVGGSLDQDLTANVEVDVMWKVFSLPNKRGLLHLSDPCGNSIDRIQYAENAPWQKRRAGRAIERVNYSTRSEAPHKLWRVVQSRMPSGDFGNPGIVSQKMLNHLRKQANSLFKYSQKKKPRSSSEKRDKKLLKTESLATDIETGSTPGNFHRQESSPIFIKTNN